MDSAALLAKSWRLKSCPRCNGDLHIDYEGDYYETPVYDCLQCGKIIEIKKAPKFEVQEPQFDFVGMSK